MGPSGCREEVAHLKAKLDHYVLRVAASVAPEEDSPVITEAYAQTRVAVRVSRAASDPPRPRPAHPFKAV
jgi:hypothetical protein